MAKKFLSSDSSLCLHKGQPLLALFAAFISLQAAAQTSAFVDAQTLSSAGQLRASHWLSESLQPSNPSHWMHYRMDVGLTHAKTDWEFELAKTRQGYLVGNGNALFLAAQDKAGMDVDLTTPGRFAIRAETWALNANKLASLYKWRPVQEFTLRIEPHLLQIQDYQHANGELTLLNQAASNQLQGQLNRVGTRHYGYLLQDQPDAGWGMGLHLDGRWKSPFGQVDGRIQNLYSQLRFSTLHYSSRQYQLQTQAGQIKVSDIPSLTGTYGLGARRESLPMVWQLLLNPVGLQDVRLGLVGMERQARLLFRYERGWNTGRWWLQTIQADNWSAGLTWSVLPQLELGMAVSTTDRLRSPMLTSIQGRMRW